MNRRIATSQTTEMGSAQVGGGAAASADRAVQDKPVRQKKSSGDKTSAKGSREDDGAPGNVGKLLRGAYRQAVDEAIPDDLMDLLNKLE